MRIAAFRAQWELKSCGPGTWQKNCCFFLLFFFWQVMMWVCLVFWHFKTSGSLFFFNVKIFFVRSWVYNYVWPRRHKTAWCLFAYKFGIKILRTFWDFPSKKLGKLVDVFFFKIPINVYTIARSWHALVASAKSLVGNNIISIENFNQHQATVCLLLEQGNTWTVFASRLFKKYCLYMLSSKTTRKLCLFGLFRKVVSSLKQKLFKPFHFG